MDQEIWPEIEKSLDNLEKIDKEFVIKNTNRAVGTRISHHLYKKYGYEKLENEFLTLNFKGSAGQSFGAFSPKTFGFTGTWRQPYILKSFFVNSLSTIVLQFSWAE